MTDPTPNRLSHVGTDGAALMVDVTEKASTTRVATAVATLKTTAGVIELLSTGQLPKGEALAVARVAGIMGAKQTSTLIPLCHPLPLSAATIDFEIGSDQIQISATVKTTGVTGVEMEALTGVTVAALTIYDMIKAVDKHAEISGIHVVSKSGGKSGDWVRESATVENPADESASVESASVDSPAVAGPDLNAEPARPREPEPSGLSASAAAGDSRRTADTVTAVNDSDEVDLEPWARTTSAVARQVPQEANADSPGTTETDGTTSTDETAAADGAAETEETAAADGAVATAAETEVEVSSNDETGEFRTDPDDLDGPMVFADLVPDSAGAESSTADAADAADGPDSEGPESKAATTEPPTTGTAAGQNDAANSAATAADADQPDNRTPRAEFDLDDEFAEFTLLAEPEYSIGLPSDGQEEPAPTTTAPPLTGQAAGSPAPSTPEPSQESDPNEVTLW